MVTKRKMEENEMAATELIKVSPDTKEKLKKLGSFGDSYDAVVRRLLEKAGVK